jgi:hypothetical protein
MDRKRGEQVNWYTVPFAERQRMMHEHGMIGRRYADQVKQIISGSIGMDDWEWGVDLFADDPGGLQEADLRDALRRSERGVRAVRAVFFGVRLPVHRRPQLCFVLILRLLDVGLAVTVLFHADFQPTQMLSQRVTHQSGAIRLHSSCCSVSGQQKLLIEDNLDRFHMSTLLHSPFHSQGPGSSGAQD